MSKINDPSLGTGVYTGDLAYGRCNGTVLDKNGDYAGESNKPIRPLTLVRPRDPYVWKRDPRLKDVKPSHLTKESIDIMQHQMGRMILTAFKDHRTNFHLTIGKERY